MLDTARYQRCKLALEKAAESGIELLFLPPYSPNLNLIERLWKFVKKEVLYSKYYDNFEKFKVAITECLSETAPETQKSVRFIVEIEVSDVHSNINLMRW